MIWKNFCAFVMVVVLTTSSAHAQNVLRLVRRHPVITGETVVVYGLVGAAAFRHLIPVAISGYGSPEGNETLDEIKGILERHPIIGKGKAAETAAYVVVAHPDLLSNAYAVMAALDIERPLFDSKLSAIVSQEKAAVAVAGEADESDERKWKCPDPELAPNETGMKKDAERYQIQVGGLPAGIAIKIDGVSFDGCRESDGVLLEAKGEGYEQLFRDSEGKNWFRGLDGIYEQAEKQSRIARQYGYGLEWHVAELYACKSLSAYLHEFSNIVFIYDPPLVPRTK